MSKARQIAATLFFAAIATPTIASATSIGNGDRIKEVVTISEKYAASRSISLVGYELHSIVKYNTEFNGYIDKDRVDKYAINFFEKLKRKEYWAVCYRIKAGVGGVTCIFVDNKSRKPLHVYVGR